MGISSGSDGVPRPLVRVEAVAEYMCCSKDYVLRLARVGRLPAMKISNGARTFWRFDIDEVRRFLNAQIATPAD